LVGENGHVLCEREDADDSMNLEDLLDQLDKEAFPRNCTWAMLETPVAFDGGAE
jgi:hypothetical protein